MTSLSIPIMFPRPTMRVNSHHVRSTGATTKEKGKRGRNWQSTRAHRVAYSLTLNLSVCHHKNTLTSMQSSFPTRNQSMLIQVKGGSHFFSNLRNNPKRQQWGGSVQMASLSKVKPSACYTHFWICRSHTPFTQPGYGEWNQSMTFS